MFVNKTYHNIELIDESGEFLIKLPAADYKTIPYFSLKMSPTKLYQIENQETKTPKSYAFQFLQLNDINLINELPEEQDGVKYIVYLEIALVLRHRKDLIIIDPKINLNELNININNLIVLNKGLM